MFIRTSLVALQSFQVALQILFLWLLIGLAGHHTTGWVSSQKLFVTPPKISSTITLVYLKMYLEPTHVIIRNSSKHGKGWYKKCSLLYGLHPFSNYTFEPLSQTSNHILRCKLVCLQILQLSVTHLGRRNTSQFCKIHRMPTSNSTRALRLIDRLLLRNPRWVVSIQEWYLPRRPCISPKQFAPWSPAKKIYGRLTWKYSAKSFRVRQSSALLVPRILDMSIPSL